MPDDDPLAPDPVAEAAYEDFLENLAPPDWFYPLVGEMASETVLLELCMTRAALALTGTKGDPLELIKYTDRMDEAIVTAAACPRWVPTRSRTTPSRRPDEGPPPPHHSRARGGPLEGA